MFCSRQEFNSVHSHSRVTIAPRILSARNIRVKHIDDLDYQHRKTTHH